MEFVENGQKQLDYYVRANQFGHREIVDTAIEFAETVEQASESGEDIEVLFEKAAIDVLSKLESRPQLKYATRVLAGSWRYGYDLNAWLLREMGADVALSGDEIDKGYGSTSQGIKLTILERPEKVRIKRIKRRPEPR